MCVCVCMCECMCAYVLKKDLTFSKGSSASYFYPAFVFPLKKEKKVSWALLQFENLWILLFSNRDYLLHNLQSNVSVSLIKVPDGVLQFIRKHFPKSSGFLFIFIRRESWHACVFDTIKWPCLTFQILMVKIIMLKSKRNNKRK